MAEPDPTEVAPWYLRNINQALALDEASGNVYVRTGFEGNIIISGNVNIPGNVDAHISEIGTSGNLTVPWMPVSIDGNSTVSISGGNIDANVSGNVGIVGNVNVTQGTDPWVVSGNVSISGTPTVTLGTDSQDAFGRLRVSNPTTLFDTQARYYNHNQFASNTVGSGTYTYDSNSSSFTMTVGTGGTDSVIAETYKVFPYQPGKSLLIYSTFCMNTPKTNVRQRVGYFGSQNGIFFEANGTTLNMVIRSYSSGSIVEDRIPQSEWNGDTMLGTGGPTNPSGLTLYPDRTQIFFCDIEWLGVGNVRVGFIVNGQYINCHTFQHANMPGNTTTYMSTACLPLRYEITNTGAPISGSTMRQICSSVISEGGYSLSGFPRSIGHSIASPVRLPNDQSFKPLMSIRLKSTCPDSIVLPKFYTIAPVAQSTFKYRIYNTQATTSGGTWTSMGSDSPVEYNLAPTSVTGGTIVAEGFIISSNQTAGAPVQVSFGFENQLQRDSFTGTMYEYVLVACTTGTNQDVYASIEWQEVN